MSDSEWVPTKWDTILMTAMYLLFTGQIVTCVLFYAWAGLSWFTASGWTVFAIGLFIGGMAQRGFTEKGGAARKQEWFKTKVLVDSGIYGAVRHPIYLSFVLLATAPMLISQHWLSVMLGLPSIAYLYYSMLAEEKLNTRKFGDEYLRYMRRVPRVNLLLGIIRLFQRRQDREGR
jgi:protein-S-isoprenylcysteine O-methyltransferase Ste14